ncbi:glutaredoxin 3 [Alphaproteobacteria bacterium]|nr:glutaredoxin 3 [Alphaproteobacteria bacterium]
MAVIEIYTSMWCPFCHRAKRLLNNKGVDFKEIDVGMNSKMREEMLDRSDGRYTVPQIFIDGLGIGGSDELADLDNSGKLDSMLDL